MYKKLLLVTLVVTFISGCGIKEKAALQSTVDSLTVELETSQRMAETLQDVGVLMDSIDANRQLLRVNMVEGTTYSDYTARMKDINNYVKDTQGKISDLETALKKSKGNTNAYAATIKKLKTDLEAKNLEITKLQELVATLGNENQNLITTNGLQQAEINDKSAQIEAKKQELD